MTISKLNLRIDLSDDCTARLVPDRESTTFIYEREFFVKHQLTPINSPLEHLQSSLK